MSDEKTALVVSAHAADYVWRCGGAVALYAARGFRVKVVCLTYGERGESAMAWKQGGQTVETVKKQRHAESAEAADILGAEIEFLDGDDYPLVKTPALMDSLVRIYRDLRPSFVLTHTREDPSNYDHQTASDIAQEARILAQAHGVMHSESKAIGAPPVFYFEPNQSEQCLFTPDVLLDITDVWDKKQAAFKAMGAQTHIWDYYTRMSEQRGWQASRNSDRKIKYAEGFQRVFPQVTGDLLA